MAKLVSYIALDMQVIAVAVEGGVGDWAAYIGAVKGDNHEREWEDVGRHGTKLPQGVAELLFPSFKHLIWRR